MNNDHDGFFYLDELTDDGLLRELDACTEQLLMHCATVKAIRNRLRGQR